MKEKKDLLAQIKDDKIQKYKLYCKLHDRAPLTRRDFLGAGIISFGGSMMLPILPQLFSTSAFAAEDCPQTPVGDTMAAFVTIHLQGGAGLAMNYLPLNDQGAQLQSYNLMGMGQGNGNVPTLTEFGNVKFFDRSQFLAQLRATATTANLGKTAFVAVPHNSQDDGNGDRNEYDVSGLVAKAGLIGKSLPNMTRNSGSPVADTGFFSTFAYLKPPAPLVVNNVASIENALRSQGGALAGLNGNAKNSLYQLVQKLSESQVQKLVDNNNGRQMASLVNCATKKNYELAKATLPSMDARANAAIAAIWQINATTAATNEMAVFASLVLAALTGEAGAVTLERGAYDYHDNTRTLGDTKDGEIGQLVGRVIETASALQKRVFINVISNGSVTGPASDDRTVEWTSDRGEAGMSYMLAFDPSATARPATSGSQIGHFTNGQIADTSFITGSSAKMAAAATFVNYLHFNKKATAAALVDQILPTGVFSAAQLNQIVKFL